MDGQDKGSSAQRNYATTGTLGANLVLEDGLILKGDKVVVPESLRAHVLEATHTDQMLAPRQAISLLAWHIL